MENMVDALKMAFAVLVFVMALTIAFTVFSQAKATSDFVIYLNDKTNFEEYVEEAEREEKIVGIETILPLVAKYIDAAENYSVEIQDANGDLIAVFDKDKEDTKIQARRNLEKQMKDLVKNYQTRKFSETYSEEIYQGDIYTTENEEQFELHDTDTKIKITYRLVN